MPPLETTSRGERLAVRIRARRRPIAAALALLLHLLAARAGADLFNQRNQLMGERAALMGGAFTAIASDLSAAWYNPAGLAEGPRFRASMSGTGYTYSHQRRTETGPQLTTPVELGVSRFSILPTTFGLGFRASDRLVVGASVFELDRFRFDATSFSRGAIVLDRGRGPIRYDEQIVRVRLESQSILGGPFVAWRLRDGLALGLSVFYHHFQGAMASSAIRSNAAGDQEQSLVQSEISSGGVVLAFGLLWRPAERWRLGLTYATETLRLAGGNTFSIGGVSSQGVTLVEKGEVRGDVRLPGRVSLGVAYERRGAFTLSIDATLHLPVRHGAPRELLRTEDPSRVHAETEHLDLAVGVEYALTRRWVLRGGLYTNTSGATQQDADLRLNHVGAAFGVGYVKEGASTGLGLNALYGQSGPQSVPGHTARVEWRRAQLQLVFGGTARFLE